MMALKDLLNNTGSNNVWCEGTGTNPNADLRYRYLMNSSIDGLEKADVFLLVGTLPRVMILFLRPSQMPKTQLSLLVLGYLRGTRKMQFLLLLKPLQRRGMSSDLMEWIQCFTSQCFPCCSPRPWTCARSSYSIESAKSLYLMGADDLNLDKVPAYAFVVYQGHHGDRSVYHASVILPSAVSDKEGTYENTEGCTQQTLPAVPTVGDVRDDWKII